MGMVQTKSLFWLAGLTVVAALMVTTTAYAQDASGGGPAVDVIVQNWHDINPDATPVVDPQPGDQGIAIGEPDPTAGGGTDPAAGDGTDPTAGDGTDPAAGGGTDPAAGDGSTDPNAGDGSTDPTAGDGSTDPNAGDGSNPTDGGAVDGGTVTIYYMDGGATGCDVCAQDHIAVPGAVRPISEVERHHHAGQPAATTVIVPTSHDEVALEPRVHATAACLGAHPALTWMCEWQSAGQ